MDTLTLLVLTPLPPPFIYIHHPHQPTTSLSLPSSTNQARVDAIECYTPKILWSAIVSRLEGKDAGLIDNLDTFIRRLKGAGQAGWRPDGNTKKSLKGKEKEKAKEVDEGRRAMSIVITKAERLPKIMGSGWAVMTRLSELVGPLTGPGPAADRFWILMM
jgi:origin recognition complex subunit 5